MTTPGGSTAEQRYLDHVLRDSDQEHMLVAEAGANLDSARLFEVRRSAQEARNEVKSYLEGRAIDEAEHENERRDLDDEQRARASALGFAQDVFRVHESNRIGGSVLRVQTGTTGADVVGVAEWIISGCTDLLTECDSQDEAPGSTLYDEVVSSPKTVTDLVIEALHRRTPAGDGTEAGEVE